MLTKQQTQHAEILTVPSVGRSPAVVRESGQSPKVLVTGVRSLHKLWVGAIVNTIVTGESGIPRRLGLLRTRKDAMTPDARRLFDAIRTLDYLEFGLYRQNYLSRDRSPVGHAAGYIRRKGAYVVNTPSSFLPDKALANYDLAIHVTECPFSFVPSALDWERLGKRCAGIKETPPSSKDVRRWAIRWMVANYAHLTRQWPTPVLVVSAEALRTDFENEIGRIQTFLDAGVEHDIKRFAAESLFGNGYLADVLTGSIGYGLSGDHRDTITELFAETIDLFYDSETRPTERLLNARSEDAVADLYERYRPQQAFMPSILRNSLDHGEEHCSIAYIPARSGSSRLKDKNITALGSKPLLAHTVKQALSIRGIDKVIVDTDDPGYADIAREYGAENLYLRPDTLSANTSSIQATVNYCIDALVKKNIIVDKFIILYPTNPFRSIKTLQHLYDLLDDYSRLSTCYRINMDFESLLVEKDGEPMQVRSSSPEKLSEYSFVKPNGFFVGRNYLCQSMEHLLYEIEDPIQCIDIDTEEDLRLARSVIDNGLHRSLG